jgi:hypothetical protein
MPTTVSPGDDLQAAIAKNTDGVMIFNPGVYTVQNELALKSGLALRAAQPHQATLLVGPANRNGTLFSTPANARDIAVEDLLFDGAQRPGTYAFAIQLAFTNLSFTGCGFSRFQTALDAKADVPKYGLRIAGCTFDTISEQALVGANLHQVLITDSAFHDCLNGVRIGSWIEPDLYATSDGVTIERCHFSSALGKMTYPIQFPGALPTDPTRRPAATSVIISDCVVVGPGAMYGKGGSGDLLALYGVQSFIVSDNQLSGGGDVGIRVQGFSGSGRILRNAVSDNFGDAIDIAAGSGYCVEDNRGERNGLRARLTPGNPPSPAPIGIFGGTELYLKRNVFTAPSGVYIDGTVGKILVDGDVQCPLPPWPAPPPGPEPPPPSDCATLRRKAGILLQKLRQLNARLAIDQQRGDAARVAADQQAIAAAEAEQAAVTQQMAEAGCDDIPSPPPPHPRG